MQNQLINITIVVAFVLTFYVIILNNWWARSFIFEYRYDLLNENEEVISIDQIDNILSKLEKINYSEIDISYLDYTKSNSKKYKHLIDNLDYFKLKRSDLNKRIVGKFRIKDFISRDKYFKDCIINKTNEVYCAFNKKIFYKTLELQQELEKLDYNKSGFIIRNGHRHPRYNEEVKGAKLSRHIKGEAVDIEVKDINNDGIENKEDKEIVLKLLDAKIIGDKGGIGLYPGTKSVHFDVRGEKARWDSY
jgi:uncharacterized protein YcbK (DUF882 family)